MSSPAISKSSTDFPVAEEDYDVSDFDGSVGQRPRRTKSAERDEAMNIHGNYRKVAPRKPQPLEASKAPVTSPRSPKSSAPADEPSLTAVARLRRASSKARLIAAIEELRSSVQASVQARLRALSTENKEKQ